MPNLTKRKLTDEQRKIVSQALWDMNLTPEEFLDIIEGKIDKKWPGRGFCVARMLESINWFDIVEIIEPKKICMPWSNAEKYVRVKSIKEGMNFACRTLQQNTLSPAR